MADYSNHQKKIIRRYYDNREQLDEQRLAELATDLYLTNGPKRKKLWETAHAILLRLNVPAPIAQHAVDSDDPAVLAELIQDLNSGSFKK